ncbi:MAG: hypothetical protein MUE37_05175 [Bacteroidales bacterium]|nr:hypothetical protein [Bacteroidales bacterium]
MLYVVLNHNHTVEAESAYNGFGMARTYIYCANSRKPFERLHETAPEVLFQIIVIYNLNIEWFFSLSYSGIIIGYNYLLQVYRGKRKPEIERTVSLYFYGIS